MKQLLPFAFSVSFVTTVALLFVEWRIPGFVSFVFPVYWLVFLTIGLGIAASQVEQEEAASAARPMEYGVALLAGLALMNVIVKSGEIFGIMQWPLAFVALVLPVVLSLSYRKS